ncbi:MAG: hypothetical protein IJ088_09050, partial [Clostridia bacterium]|nr:hypothetical protein [Clostridia bacterium]
HPLKGALPMKSSYITSWSIIPESVAQNKLIPPLRDYSHQFLALPVYLRQGTCGPLIGSSFREKLFLRMPAPSPASCRTAFWSTDGY